MPVKMSRKPVPNGTLAMMGTIQCVGGADVHANQNRPMGSRHAPTEQPTRRASGATFSPRAFARADAWLYMRVKRGVIALPRRRPTPMPRKARPERLTGGVSFVCGIYSLALMPCRLQHAHYSRDHPRYPLNTIGNASKKRYNVP
jgi:hypothetical protein